MPWRAQSFQLNTFASAASEWRQQSALHWLHQSHSSKKWASKFEADEASSPNAAACVCQVCAVRHAAAAGTGQHPLAKVVKLKHARNNFDIQHSNWRASHLNISCLFAWLGCFLGSLSLIPAPQSVKRGAIRLHGYLQNVEKKQEAKTATSALKRWNSHPIHLNSEDASLHGVGIWTCYRPSTLFIQDWANMVKCYRKRHTCVTSSRNKWHRLSIGVPKFQTLLRATTTCNFSSFIPLMSPHPQL